MINNNLKFVTVYDNANGERLMLSAPAKLGDEEIEAVITDAAFEFDTDTKDFFDALAKFGIEEVTEDLNVVVN